MSTRLAALMGILSAGVLVVPLAAEAQPTLEQLRFDPPQLCFRDTFRWGFSYRGLPGGLASVFATGNPRSRIRASTPGW